MRYTVVEAMLAQGDLGAKKLLVTKGCRWNRINISTN